MVNRVRLSTLARMEMAGKDGKSFRVIVYLAVCLDVARRHRVRYGRYCEIYIWQAAKGVGLAALERGCTI